MLSTRSTYFFNLIVYYFLTVCKHLCEKKLYDPHRSGGLPLVYSDAILTMKGAPGKMAVRSCGSRRSVTEGLDGMMAEGGHDRRDRWDDGRGRA